MQVSPTNSAVLQAQLLPGLRNQPLPRPSTKNTRSSKQCPGLAGSAAKPLFPSHDTGQWQSPPQHLLPASTGEKAGPAIKVPDLEMEQNGPQTAWQTSKTKQKAQNILYCSPCPPADPPARLWLPALPWMCLQPLGQASQPLKVWTQERG